jgi:hypothetical protein
VIRPTSRRAEDPAEWVLLSYRVPREPSTPRIAVWRKLKRLGVVQIGDGVVALPADARTREQLGWVAEEIEQVGGAAMVWAARPDSVQDEHRLAQQMAAARAAEYASLRDQAVTAAEGRDPATVSAALRRYRAELRRIERRDFFPPAERAAARAAVDALAVRLAEVEQALR